MYRPIQRVLRRPRPARARSSPFHSAAPLRAQPGAAGAAEPKSTFLRPNPDIKHVRLNPGLYSTECLNRNYTPLAPVPFDVARRFGRWKELQVAMKPLRAEARRIHRALSAQAYRTALDGGADGEADAGADAAGLAAAEEAAREELIEAGRLVKEQLADMEAEEGALEADMRRLTLLLPNLSSLSTPVGSTPIVLESYLPTTGAGVGRAAAAAAATTDGPAPVARSHVSIGQELDLLDFAGAAVTSGWGWYFLKNEAALLELGLAQFVLETAVGQYGFRPVSPPSMVYGHVAAAAGFQPRDQNGERQVYTVGEGNFGFANADSRVEALDERNAVPAAAGTEAGAETTERDATATEAEGTPTPTAPSGPDLATHVLAGTAEIPLAGMRANTTLPESALPDKVIGVSRCFRAEAGARGVDTKGLYRVHEFTKVEMFGWTLPGVSEQTHFAAPPEAEGAAGSGGLVSHADKLLEEIVEVQKHVLKALQLPFRVLEQPTADLGASASRKIDIEVWFPGRAAESAAAAAARGEEGLLPPAAGPGAEVGNFESAGYGEVSSASNCTDFQSRRLNTKVRTSPRPGMGGPESVYAHTCNGTAAAMPRLIAALLENGWDESRKAVWVPEVLRRWVGGREWIGGRTEE